MTAIKYIKLQNFRSHRNIDINFNKGITLITGLNGSGKTSILEAIYINLNGSLFRGAYIDIVNHNSDWWRVDIINNSNTTRSVLFDSSKSIGRRKFIIDNKVSYRLSQNNKFPIVLFEPDDLLLINGSPSRRRLFIDNLICQLNPNYKSILNKYDRALKQRNNLLKNVNAKKDELFVWDLLISDYGYIIIKNRVKYINLLETKLSKIYNSISNTNDMININYSHNISNQKLLNDLNNSHTKDKLSGSTSIGPHRHDVIVLFNNKPANTTASRGEIRSIILSLKFLEVKIIEDILNTKPIILLDDVYSELDENRRNKLINNVVDYQVIMTNTHTISDFKSYNHIKL